MTEAEFWAKVRANFPPGWMKRRIEDASGNLGTFDLFFGRRDLCGWLELKVAGPNARPKLRPGQPSFGADCFDAGIPAGYLVGSPDGQVRLIGPLTRGHDWREHLIMRWPTLDMQQVLLMLFDNSLD